MRSLGGILVVLDAATGASDHPKPWTVVAVVVVVPNRTVAQRKVTMLSKSKKKTAKQEMPRGLVVVAVERVFADRIVPTLSIVSIVHCSQRPNYPLPSSRRMAMIAKKWTDLVQEDQMRAMVVVVATFAKEAGLDGDGKSNNLAETAAVVAAAASEREYRRCSCPPEPQRRRMFLVDAVAAWTIVNSATRPRMAFAKLLLLQDSMTRTMMMMMLLLLLRTTWTRYDVFGDPHRRKERVKTKQMPDCLLHEGPTLIAAVVAVVVVVGTPLVKSCVALRLLSCRVQRVRPCAMVKMGNLTRAKPMRPTNHLVICRYYPPRMMISFSYPPRHVRSRTESLLSSRRVMLSSLRREVFCACVFFDFVDWQVSCLATIV